MNSKTEDAGAGACWFVGAMYGGTEDQTPRFLQEGVWENGYSDKYIDEVKSIQAGDRIAIKSSYIRKHGLPFDNRGLNVSVMAIKAIGTVKENLGDGRTLKVDWIPYDPPREWYFHTNRGTVWRVSPGNWITDALIGFTFEGKNQDIDRFRNYPLWCERFGDIPDDNRRFDWTRFYTAFADKLLPYKNKRHELVAKLHELSSSTVGMGNVLNDQLSKNEKSPLQDICPFTFMALFNRDITNENRWNIASKLAEFLKVDEPAPDIFDGVPLANNQNSWFFCLAYERKADDIDALWEVFERAIAYADSNDQDQDTRSAFMKAYDDAAERCNVGWNLTMGLFWIRPERFPTLDSRSRKYISNKLHIKIGMNNPKGYCNAADYLKVMESLNAHFQEATFPVHSFPELSLTAWNDKDGGVTGHPTDTESDVQNDQSVTTPEADITVPLIKPLYTIDNIVEDGCFINREYLDMILDRLRRKKNLILQGPPGTGKTWLAKRLAYALMGRRDDGKVRAVQFHPNLSYEDFIRGWRPEGKRKLNLVDGPFMEMINAAKKDPKSNYVAVIEEINRGNPAQIFGEMLTLLEADKRTPDAALQLTHKRSDDERVYIPENLYVIGTMNIADRSLALVDLALRRRFAFIELEPTFGKPWRDWCLKHGVNNEELDEIEKRINELNKKISEDANLGRQFRIGHSYVTPSSEEDTSDARKWFREVVETEIGPLLNEYWFDKLDEARKARESLLEGF